MNKLELFKMAFTNLFRRKARSILAILGVVIGTASIITMVSIGLGMTKNFNDAIQNAPDLHLMEIFGVNNRNDTGQKKFKMDDNTVKYLKTIKGVTFATPVANLNTRIIIGDYVADANITAIDPEFFRKVRVHISKGRELKEGEKFKFLFGSQSVYRFENYKTGKYLPYSPNGSYEIDLLSPKIEITNDTEYKKSKHNNRPNFSENQQGKDAPKYEVFKGESVGVITDQNQYGYSIYTNFETLKLIKKSNTKAENSAGQRRDRYDNEQQYEFLMVYVDDINDVEYISKQLEKDGFQFYSIMNDVRKKQKEFAMVQNALGGIGAVSLLVAAIGIANTMIMSIYERRKEIGVMKVIGASLKDIKSLFLYEAASIGLIGGIIGSIISIIISLIINTFLNVDGNSMMGDLVYYLSETGEPIKSSISYMPFWLIGFGVVFSTIIGILSGYLPAKKAMSLSALESLRTE